jgi:hypothetical protein
MNAKDLLVNKKKYIEIREEVGQPGQRLSTATVLCSDEKRFL